MTLGSTKWSETLAPRGVWQVTRDLVFDHLLNSYLTVVHPSKTPPGLDSRHKILTLLLEEDNRSTKYPVHTNPLAHVRDNTIVYRDESVSVPFHLISTIEDGRIRISGLLETTTKAGPKAISSSPRFVQILRRNQALADTLAKKIYGRNHFILADPQDFSYTLLTPADYPQKSQRQAEAFGWQVKRTAFTFEDIIAESEIIVRGT